MRLESGIGPRWKYGVGAEGSDKSASRAPGGAELVLTRVSLEMRRSALPRLSFDQLLGL